MALALGAACIVAACGASGGAAPAGGTSGGSAPGKAAASPAASPAGSGSAGRGAAAKPSTTGSQTTTITFLTPTPDPIFAPEYIAVDTGMFRAQGLSVRFAHAAGPTLVPAMLQSPHTFSAVVGIDAQAEHGAPVRLLLVSSIHPDYVILGAPSIQKLSQLRGKVIVISDPKIEPGAVAELALEQAGLQPSDVKILAINGSNAERLGLVASGKAAAAEVSIDSQVYKLLAGGYHLLATTDKVNLPFSGLGVSTAEMQHYPNVVRKVISVLLQADKLAATNEGLFAKAMEHYLQLSPAQAARTFKLLQPGWTSDGRPSAAAVANEMRVNQQLQHLPTKPTPRQVYDLSWLPAAPSQSG